MRAILEKHFTRYGFRGLGLSLIGLSVAALGGAFISQYGFGLKPCVLCLYQRYPYVVAATLGLLILLLRDKASRELLAVLAIVALLVGASIATYHVGVEQKWWEGTSECGSDLAVDSVEALRAKIMGAATVRCDEPAFVFLGISMAGYNALYGFGTALLVAHYLCTLRGKTRGKKKRKA